MTHYQDFILACDKALNVEVEKVMEEYRGMRLQTSSLYEDLEGIAHKASLILALKKSKGVQTTAGKTLGIGRQAVERYCKRYGVIPEQYKERK